MTVEIAVSSNVRPGGLESAAEHEPQAGRAYGCGRAGMAGGDLTDIDVDGDGNSSSQIGTIFKATKCSPQRVPRATKQANSARITTSRFDFISPRVSAYPTMIRRGSSSIGVPFLLHVCTRPQFPLVSLACRRLR